MKGRKIRKSNLIGFNISGKSIAKNASLGLLVQALIKFKGLIFLPIIVNHIYTSEIGVWRIIITSSSLLLPVLSLNLFDGTGMYFSSDFDIESVKRKFNTIFTFSLIIMLILMVPTSIILYNIKILSSYWMIVISLTFSMFLLKAGLSLFQSYQKASELLIINVVIEYGSALVSVLFIYFIINDYLSLIAPIILFNIIVAFTLLFFINREFRLEYFIDKVFLNKAIKTSIPLIPVFLGEWVLNSIGIYFLGYYSNNYTIGLYSVALSIASLFLALKATLQYFWFSTASNLINNSLFEKFNKLFSITLKTYYFIVLSGIMFYIFFSEDLILLFASREYLVVKNSVILLSIGFGFLVVSNINNGILYAKGYTKEILYSYIITTVLNIICNILLIPRYGLIGLASSTALSYTVLHVVMNIFSSKLIKYRSWEPIRLLILVGFIFVLLSFILVHLDIQAFSRRVLGIIVLSVFIIVLKKSNIYDLSLIKDNFIKQ